MPVHHRRSVLLGAVFTGLLCSTYGYAIPAFSRQYGTSCSTCHVDFPKLNDFGKAFKDAGFKFPKDDETFIKTPPVMLGAPAQKELWPHTIFPGTIPGMPPIGLRFNQFFQVVSNNRNNFNLQNAGRGHGTAITFRAQISSRAFSASSPPAILEATSPSGWMTTSASRRQCQWWLGDAYLRFVNLGRFLKMPTESLTPESWAVRTRPAIHPGSRLRHESL